MAKILLLHTTDGGGSLTDRWRLALEPAGHTVTYEDTDGGIGDISGYDLALMADSNPAGNMAAVDRLRDEFLSAGKPVLFFCHNHDDFNGTTRVSPMQKIGLAGYIWQARYPNEYNIVNNTHRITEGYPLGRVALGQHYMGGITPIAGGITLAEFDPDWPSDGGSTICLYPEGLTVPTGGVGGAEWETDARCAYWGLSTDGVYGGDTWTPAAKDLARRTVAWLLDTKRVCILYGSNAYEGIEPQLLAEGHTTEKFSDTQMTLAAIEAHDWGQYDVVVTARFRPGDREAVFAALRERVVEQARTPMIVDWDWAGARHMGLAGAESASDICDDIVIVDNAHPITAGLELGRLAIRNSLTWQTAPVEAIGVELAQADPDTTLSGRPILTAIEAGTLDYSAVPTGARIACFSLYFHLQSTSIVTAECKDLTVRILEWVTDPPAPNTSIDAPATGASYTEGDPVTLIGSAVDAEDGPLGGDALSWSSSIDGALGMGDALVLSDLSVGAHTITLTATNSAGVVGTASIELTVVANAQPIATITSPESGAQLFSGRPVTLEGNAVDAEDGPLEGDALVWTYFPDGVLTGDPILLGTGGVLVTTALPVGEHAIRLTATDRHGSTSEHTIVVSVSAPSWQACAEAPDTPWADGTAAPATPWGECAAPPATAWSDCSGGGGGGGGACPAPPLTAAQFEAVAVPFGSDGYAWRFVEAPDGALLAFVAWDVYYEPIAVYRSEDAGATWAKVHTFDAGDFMYELAIATPEAVYVLENWDGHYSSTVGNYVIDVPPRLWKSTDGITWAAIDFTGAIIGEPAHTQPQPVGSDDNVMAFDPETGTLYVYCYIGSTGRYFVFRSTDGGDTWDTATLWEGSAPASGAYHYHIVAGGGKLIAFGERGWVWTSADRGDTWSEQQVPLGGSARRLYIGAHLAGHFAIVSDGSWSALSSDGGDTFTPLADLGYSSYPVDLAPGCDGFLLTMGSGQQRWIALDGSIAEIEEPSTDIFHALYIAASRAFWMNRWAEGSIYRVSDA